MIELKTLMPKRSRALVASGLLLCALAARAGAVSSVPAEHPAWGGFFSEALNDSDLDVRDAHNRPVRTFQAQAQLKDLFTTTVFTLLATRTLPFSALARKMLEECSAPFAERLVRSAFRLWGAAETLIFEGRKAALQALSALPSVLLLIFFTGGFLRRSRAVLARVTPSLLLPLRC